MSQKMFEEADGRRSNHRSSFIQLLVLKIGLIVLVWVSSGTVAHAQNGGLAWVKRAGSNSIDEGNAIAVDPNGNVYATGYFKSSATFGQGEANETVLTALNQDLFLAKYAASGELTWVRQAKGFAWGNAIDLDMNGNIYVFGHFASATTFNPDLTGEIALPGVGSQALFLAKFDSDGICLWAKLAGGLRSEYGYGLAVDDQGSSYVTGRYGSNPVIFAAGEVNETQLPGIDGNNGEDIFVAKYDTNGVLQWAKNAGGANGNNAAGIGVDSAHNCYVAGRFSGTATFGPGEAGETVLDTGGVFIAKLAPDGNLAWVRGSANGEGNAIAVDVDGNSYITGTYSNLPPFGGQLNQTQLNVSSLNNIFVAKHDSGGALQWVKMVVGSASEYALGIALDETGNSYITGYGSGLIFGAEEPDEVSLGGVGAQDIFVAKFDPDGLAQWAKLAGGSSDDRGHGIAVGLGAVYVTGHFASTATFGSGEANQTAITSRSNFDIFVAKFQSDEVTVRPLKFVGIHLLSNGHPELTLSGTSSKTFTIRCAETLSNPTWNSIGVIATNAQGQAVFEDGDEALLFPAFYQAVGN